MPSFILRDIDPAFWRRVKSKAAAEGVTVKELILRLLTKWLGLFALLLVSACAPPLLTAPAPTPPVAAVPASLSLTGGSATSAHQVLLNLVVLDAAGKGVPGASVSLTTTFGTLNHYIVTTGPTGTAQAILTTTRTATVTAQTGGLTATATATAFSR